MMHSDKKGLQLGLNMAEAFYKRFSMHGRIKSSSVPGDKCLSLASVGIEMGYISFT